MLDIVIIIVLQCLRINKDAAEALHAYANPPAVGEFYIAASGHSYIMLQACIIGNNADSKSGVSTLEQV